MIAVVIFDMLPIVLAVPGSPEPVLLLITNVKSAEIVARIC